ncbi:hypothetical protein [Pseudomonas sp. Irchel 3E13]|uniref:hypothetical protein n=1 Tax=Pseudomonas sp. Irchel 3E13 TaxID=2008975 RepID=UPI000BA2DFBC|nr:hypothetical protein [Pseudomonas sp. Irchel 3E13]
MRQGGVLIVMTLLALGKPGLVIANDDPLDAIANFAERICSTPEAKGNSQTTELSGAAKAELKGLVKKVVDLGIDGAAKYESKEYEGVLQQDLAPLISKSTTCKESISQKLIDKLVTDASITPELKSYPVKLRGQPAQAGTASGITMSINIEGEEYEFDNRSGSLLVDVGTLTEGTHDFNFENINGYFMHPVAGPQLQASGLSCAGAFTVSKKKTFQIIAWVDATGLKCDLR